MSDSGKTTEAEAERAGGATLLSLTVEEGPQVYCLNEAWGREDLNGMRMKWEQLWCICDRKGIKGKKEALRVCL